MKQVNKNFIYNIVYQIFIYIIPLISVPYVSRVLGVNNIGIYSYTYSIVYYFMLAAMIGINNYGSRKIAKCKENIEARSFNFFSIYLLQLMLSVLMIILYSGFIFIWAKEYKTIMFIQIIYLISVIFDINWFYFGIEKFKITISRNVIIKLLSLICIFIFVKNDSDLWKYTVIMNISTLISQIYLWIYLKRYVKFVKVTIKDIVGHFKKCLILFIPVIAYSVYRVMDKTMIGAIAGTTELGYYENAEKIISIPVSFITALGTVMLPYMSKNDNNTKEEFNRKLNSSFELCFCFIIPMFFGLLAVAKKFSNVFFGVEFYKSGIIIQILSITILFSSIANVIRTNYLIPKEKDNIYVISTIIGAVLNLIFNIILIPRLEAYGACIGTIIAECSVMIYQLLSVKNEIEIMKMLKMLKKYFIKGLIMFAIILCLGKIINNEFASLITQVIIAVSIYFSLNYKYIIYDFLGKKRSSEK